MKEKQIKIDNIGNLKIQFIEVSDPITNTIIVGNAYGIMPYIKPLATKLSENGIQPHWFAFSGQERTEGEYSQKQCVNDIVNVVNYVKGKNSNVNFLSHCAGSLMTLEYLKLSKDPDIKKVVIYGLLYTMNRRRIIAERKLNNCKVKYNLSEEDWAYNPLEAIDICHAEILFCHAKDKLNFERATELEMNLVISHQRKNKIKWFEKGYDEDNSEIDNYIDTYVSFLTKR